MKKGIWALLIGGAFGTGFFLGGKTLVGMVNDYKMRMNRNLSNMMLLNDWLDFIYSGGSVDEYFHAHGYNKVMIYGNGYIGARLSQALAGTDIDVIAVMDKAASSNRDGEVIGVSSKIPEVDCIVITPTFYYDEIFHMLRGKTDIPIVSIQTIMEKDVI